MSLNREQYWRSNLVQKFLRVYTSISFHDSSPEMKWKANPTTIGLSTLHILNKSPLLTPALQSDPQKSRNSYEHGTV